MSACRCARALLFVFAVLLCAQTAFAQAQDDAFRNGLRARGDKRWAEVVVQMRSAIQAEGMESSSRKIRLGFLGINSMEYLPHFFLGEALFYLGDCAGAVTEWAESQRQGAVAARRDYVMLIQGWYGECGRKGVSLPGEFEPLVERAEQAIKEASAAGQDVVDRAQTNVDLWKPGQDFRARYERDRARVEAASSKFVAGRRARSAPDLNDARANAEAARDGFRQLAAELARASDLQAALGRLEPLVQQALVVAGNAEQSINQLLAQTSLKVTLPTPLEAARQKAEDLYARARVRQAAGTKGRDIAALEDALKTARDASTALNDVRDQIDRFLSVAADRGFAQEVTAGTEAFSLADQVMVAASRLSAQSAGRSDVVQVRESARQLLEEGRRRFDAARKRQDLAGIKDAVRMATEARDRLNAMITSYGGGLTLEQRGVHPALVTGSRHYFAGEYQQALSALEDPALGASVVPMQLHAHVFRAASLFALSVSSEPPNESLKTRAEAEVRLCQGIDPAFRPDSRAFSPRFVRFFEATLAAQP
jgi:hypothetical protein